MGSSQSKTRPSRLPPSAARGPGATLSLANSDSDGDLIEDVPGSSSDGGNGFRGRAPGANASTSLIRGGGRSQFGAHRVATDVMLDEGGEQEAQLQTFSTRKTRNVYNTFQGSPPPNELSDLAGASKRRLVIDHWTQPTDTLMGLSVRYNVSTQRLKQENGLFSDDLFHLKSILVPCAVDPQSVLSGSGASSFFVGSAEASSVQVDVADDGSSSGAGDDGDGEAEDEYGSASGVGDIFGGSSSAAAPPPRSASSRRRNRRKQQHHAAPAPKAPPTVDPSWELHDGEVLYEDDYVCVKEHAIIIHHYYAPEGASRRVAFADVDGLARVKSSVVPHRACVTAPAFVRFFFPESFSGPSISTASSSSTSSSSSSSFSCLLVEEVKRPSVLFVCRRNDEVFSILEERCQNKSVADSFVPGVGRR